jgi:hypothetical protein
MEAAEHVELRALFGIWYKLHLRYLLNMRDPEKNFNKIYGFVRTTQETLPLRYERNRLMLPTGLWRWYINVTITILYIIHRPVFYLELNSTLYVCPYLTGSTLPLLYEPNRLMLLYVCDDGILI